MRQLPYIAVSGAPLHRRVLFVPGVGGWRGWAITIAETMATWGFDVQGLDTKVYLDGFTGKSMLTEGDVTNDFRELAEGSPTDRVSEPVVRAGPPAKTLRARRRTESSLRR